VIFVTGGTGLLGAHLLFQLTKDETEIRAIYRSDRKRDQVKQLFQFYDKENGENRYAQIEWVKGDILDIPFLQEKMKDCDEVYHSAALVSFHHRDFNRLIKINREGTANMVNVALETGARKFCYVSSTAAIGGNDNDVINEETKWKISPATSGYSVSKYSAEKEVWRAVEEGLNVVIVNPCVIVGAGNWDESSLTLFRTLKKGVKFYPPGANAIVDARDVAEIMQLLMKSDISNQRFLCIGSNQSFKDLMEEIASQLNVKVPRIEAKRYMVAIARRLLSLFALFTSKRSSMTRDTVRSLFSKREYDNSKVVNALDFKFRSLKDSIDNAIKGRIR